VLIYLLYKDKKKKLKMREKAWLAVNFLNRGYLILYIGLKAAADYPDQI
jgi:hypothetical protein